MDATMTSVLASHPQLRDSCLLRSLRGQQMPAAAVDERELGRQGGRQQVNREDVDGERVASTRRSLVKGMTVMVNRNAKFHQARPSCCPVIRRKSRWWTSQNWAMT